MTVELRIDGRAVPLRLERGATDWVAGGRAVSVLEVEPGIYSVLLDGRSFEARIEANGDRWIVTIRGRRFEIEVADPRRMRRGGAALRGAGRAQVAAPMPGRVLRVLAAEGDAVEAGQGLLVIEAMKMQNEIKAPQAGRLAVLHAKEGQAVAAGEILAAIE
jgi:biotin carboxyl carrier protein